MIETMEEKIREWAAELFRLCDEAGRFTQADVEFQLSTKSGVFCMIEILKGRIRENYRLYLDPPLWEITAENYRKAREQLRILLKEKPAQKQ